MQKLKNQTPHLGKRVTRVATRAQSQLRRGVVRVVGGLQQRIGEMLASGRTPTTQAVGREGSRPHISITSASNACGVTGLVS